MVKVLLIDDEPLIAKMYAQALPPSEFTVVTVLHSDEAVEVAAREKPDIILLDIMMPEPNGVDVLRSLKSSETTKSITVVMLTNLKGKYDIEAAKAEGAADFWIKNDIEMNSLADKIKRTLQGRTL